MLILKICTFPSSSAPIFAGKGDCSEYLSFGNCSYKKTIHFYSLQLNKFWNGKLKGRIYKINKIHSSSLHSTGGPAASICMVSVMVISEENVRCLHWHAIFLHFSCLLLLISVLLNKFWDSCLPSLPHPCLVMKCILTFVMIQIFLWKKCWGVPRHKIKTIKCLVYDNSHQKNKTKPQNNQKGNINTWFCL